MQAKTAVLLGATGLTGNYLLHLLLADDYFAQIRVLVRKPFAFIHPRLEVCVTDFDDHNNFHRALGKGDTIFCCIGTTMKKVNGDKALYRRIDFNIPVHAAQWGIDNGFSQYLVVSAIGANAKSSNFYLSLKGSMEEAIHALPYTSLHIFRPSLLLGSREGRGSGGNEGGGDGGSYAQRPPAAPRVAAPAAAPRPSAPSAPAANNFEDHDDDIPF